MAGIPTIPPLLSNTPPPIDFGEEDDDSGLPPTLALEDDDDDFGDFALAADMNEDATNADVSSLPRTPLQFELSSSTTTSGFTDVPPTFEDCGNESITPPPPLKSIFSNSSAHEEDKYKTQLNEAYNYNITKAVNAEGDRTQYSDDSGEEMNNRIDVLNAQTQKVSDDNKKSTIDSNDAKNTNSTCTKQAQTPTSTVENTKDIQNVCNSANEQESNGNLNTISEMPQNSPLPLAANVLLEDVAEDSSDEECYRSPKKSLSSPTSPKDDFDSDDFFAIHVVEDSSSSSSATKQDKPTPILEDINMNTFSNHNKNVIDNLESKTDANLNGDKAVLQLQQQPLGDEHDDEFGDFADFTSATEYMKSAPAKDSSVDADNVFSNENMEAVDEPPADNGSLANDDDDDDDFDDFQDFCAAPTVEPTAPTGTSSTNASIITQTNDITTAESKEVVEESVTAPKIEEKALENNNADCDDDDFGDFAAASFDTPSPEVALTTQTPHSQYVTTVTSGNISEHLGTVLKQMFPHTNDQLAGNEVASAKETKSVKTLPGLQSADATLPFESIETAKALEFQWPQSEMRHALIRAIGIDSRNILFGENWNPAMPRFAANLSFNPLQPMKPETANTSSSISAASGSSGGATYADATAADSIQYSTNNSKCASNMEMSSYAMKTDVPEVGYDWQGAGLLNPLDGVKSETNTREAETIHSTPPVARLDTPDDQQQSHTTFTNISDDISETLRNTNIEVMSSPLRDVSHTPLPLDMTTQHFVTQDTCITSNNNNFNNSVLSNSKTYDNTKILTTLRLGANIFNNEQVDIDIDDDDDEDETVVTSTYAGPLKETHIYTPSKTELAIVKSNKSAAINSEPIDFDYEIAAAGIIIDEKVVKKEYRDVEYNPGFSLEVVNEYAEETPASAPTILSNETSMRAVLPPNLQETPAQTPTAEFDNDDFTEFTEFQSVPPTHATSLPTIAAATASLAATTNSTSTITSAFPVESTSSKTINNSTQPVLPAAVAKTKETTNTPSRTNSPSVIDNMILSPAILLPQAIPIGANNTATKKATTPAIEWGDSTANIDPDELARIEELFPQPKITAATNLTQKSTPPTHNIATTTISATVAMKEQDSALNDDYWSEFVSVPAKPQLPSPSNRLNNNSANISNNNNNNNNQQLVITATNNALRSPRQQQKQQLKMQRTLTPTPQQYKSNAALNAVTSSTRVSANKTSIYNNSSSNSNSNINISNSNDDDWSDFVSSTPAPPQASSNSFTHAAHAPQFNSAAWQNANFYNNPLGLYHQHAVNMHTRNTPLLTPQQQQLQLQQQIHIMQDFSTAPTTATTGSRPNINLHHSNNSNMAHINNMQQHSSNTYSPLQVGNARVAPSISLIPDLGFVAPALPVHTAFVNVLPKTSFNSNNKK